MRIVIVCNAKYTERKKKKFFFDCEAYRAMDLAVHIGIFLSGRKIHIPVKLKIKCVKATVNPISLLNPRAASIVLVQREMDFLVTKISC